MSGNENEDHVSIGVDFVFHSGEVSTHVLLHCIAPEGNVAKLQLLDAQIFKRVCRFPSSRTVAAFTQSFKRCFNIYPLNSNKIKTVRMENQKNIADNQT